MCRVLVGALSVVLAALGLGVGVQAAEPVRVISDRTPSHLEPLFARYTEAKGVEILPVFVEEGLVARLQSRPAEADLVITKTADLLEAAKGDGLLQPFESETIVNGVAPEFRDADNTYVTLSYRPRGIFASKERVAPGAIATYDDLTDSQWRGRVCIRSGYHDYNLSLFSQMAADRGLDATRAFIKGLQANLARTPTGNDRAQVRAIYEGECDLSIGNSYYMPLMLSRDDQRPWGEATFVVFPDQAGDGAYVMRGGAALTTATDNLEAATELLEYLVGEEAQEFIVNTTFEYSILDSVDMPAPNRALGAQQPEVQDGRFKAEFIPLDAVAAEREAVVRILDEVDFDGN
jgi:iron(III) transport system substrate-binding protein